MWQPDGWAQNTDRHSHTARRRWPGAGIRRDGSGWNFDPRCARSFRSLQAGRSDGPTIADDPVRGFADPPLVDEAAELLASAPLHAIVYAFTSSSYVRGAADDTKLKKRLETRTRGIPVIITCAAAVTALTALGVKRLALIQSAVVLG